MKYIALATIVVGNLVFLGCGGGQDSATDAPASTSTASQQMPAGSASEAGLPSETVGQFYEALRSGDAQAIANLLTDKAREETARSGLDIRPQGSTSLSYELGEIDYVTEDGDGAHVKSLWTETDPTTGQAATSEVIWVLRKQTEGWRIAGMATPIQEGQLPLLFNFEDPEDMMWKKNYIENEMAGTHQIENPQGYTVGDTPEAEQAVAPADAQLR